MSNRFMLVRISKVESLVKMQVLNRGVGRRTEINRFVEQEHSERPREPMITKLTYPLNQATAPFQILA